MSIYLVLVGLLVSPMVLAHPAEMAAQARAVQKSAVDPEFNPEWSAARAWVEATLFGIRRDLARPVVHARNLYHLSICFWDAWAAYSTNGEDQIRHFERATAEDIEAARAEAISYAAYRLLRHRYVVSPGAAAAFAHHDEMMQNLGYDKDIVTTEGDSPAALGNRIAATVIAYYAGDGANEANNYAANIGYVPVNDPLVVAVPGPNFMADPNRWQPLALDFFIDQGGVIIGAYPSFIGPHWGGVIPFALKPWHMGTNTWHDPGPPPKFRGVGDATYRADCIEMIRLSSQLDPADDVMIDISPGAKGNNPLGANTGTGHPLNPKTSQPYAPNIVKRADYGRTIAEFWADGPSSDTPPGHWNVLANYTSDLHDQNDLRIGGDGPPLDRLQWDVKLYLAINGALHDVGVTAWGIKGFYDGTRPISAIRHMCSWGQSSDPQQPSYHSRGIPLEPGLVEVITMASASPGQRHEHLADNIGQIAVLSWLGAPENPTDDYLGVGWILGTAWLPYQRPTFVTPPFAGYISGHSTFSRASAEVLTRFTGDAFFPGGLGEFEALQNQYLVFEDGPSTDVTLQWATFYDAADQSADSRVWGGIHCRYDDFPGRRIGSVVGRDAFQWAMQIFEGKSGQHSADADGDGILSLSELLRIIQFYNAGGLHCQKGTEDGYAPYDGEDKDSTAPHESDYAPQDWAINLSELLRAIQLYNSGGYSACADGEDLFCPGEA